ncbi:MAG: hypothetical protein AAF928_15980 [Myxococcota bacterium]
MASTISGINAPLLVAAAVAAGQLSSSSGAGAEESTSRREVDVSPIEEDGVENPGAAALDAVTLVPRWLIGALAGSAVATARFVHDGQLVPRYEAQLAPSRDVRVLAFPTIFASTERTASAGGRMIVASPLANLSAQFGVGGVGDWELQTRARFALRRAEVPVVLGISATARNATRLDYLGLGQRPERDDRNEFVGAPPPEPAQYDEQRRRAVVSLGTRVLDHFQILVTTSADGRDIRRSTIDDVFVTGSVAQRGSDDWQAYHEMNVRLDTRPFLAPPVQGWIAEGFVGVAHPIRSETTPYVRTGGLVSPMIPIVHPNNILAPRLVVEQTVPLGASPLSFTEFSRPFAYRGRDERRDRSTWTLGVDYTWPLTSFMSGRLFVDAAAVAPALDQAFDQPPSVAAGLGLDVYRRGFGIGQLFVGWSTDGPVASLRLGDPSPWGDRQRRE